LSCSTPHPSFLSHSSAAPRYLHSFPTRRSSDLGRATYPVNTVVRCAGTGSAFILIHRSVFERIEADQGPVWYDRVFVQQDGRKRDRKSTRLNSSHVKISYAVFCLKKKNYITTTI